MKKTRPSNRKEAWFLRTGRQQNGGEEVGYLVRCTGHAAHFSVLCTHTLRAGNVRGRLSEANLLRQSQRHPSDPPLSCPACMNTT